MLTSHELFGFMSPALANEIVAFTHESDKPAYKATLAAVAVFALESGKALFWNARLVKRWPGRIQSRSRQSDENADPTFH